MATRKLRRWRSPTYNLQGGSFPGTIDGVAYEHLNLGDEGSGGAPAGAAKAGGNFPGTYLADLEDDAAAEALNRAGRALGESIDTIDDILRDSVPALGFITVVTGSAQSYLTLSGSVYALKPTESGSITAAQVFVVTTAANAAVMVAGAVAAVTGCVDDATASFDQLRTSADGFVDGVRVTTSATLPAGTYRVWCGLRRSLARLSQTPWELYQPQIQQLQGHAEARVRFVDGIAGGAYSLASQALSFTGLGVGADILRVGTGVVASEGEMRVAWGFSLWARNQANNANNRLLRFTNLGELRLLDEHFIVGSGYVKVGQATAPVASTGLLRFRHGASALARNQTDDGDIHIFSTAGPSIGFGPGNILMTSLDNVRVGASTSSTGLLRTGTGDLWRADQIPVLDITNARARIMRRVHHITPASCTAMILGKVGSSAAPTWWGAVTPTFNGGRSSIARADINASGFVSFGTTPPSFAQILSTDTATGTKFQSWTHRFAFRHTSATFSTTAAFLGVRNIATAMNLSNPNTIQSLHTTDLVFGLGWDAGDHTSLASAPLFLYVCGSGSSNSKINTGVNAYGSGHFIMRCLRINDVASPNAMRLELWHCPASAAGVNETLVYALETPAPGPVTSNFQTGDPTRFIAQVINRSEEPDDALSYWFGGFWGYE